MERTSYNVDAFKKHQLNRTKDYITLDKKEQNEILLCVSELKDMQENDEFGITQNALLARLNTIGAIIANK